MKKLAQNVLYWKMATLRCLIYSLVIGGTTFLAQTETFTGEDWAGMSTFAHVRIYIYTGVAVVSTIVAFLDNTMSKLNAGVNGNGTVPPEETASPAISKP